MKPFLFPTFAPYESHQARQPYISREKHPDSPFRIGDVFGLRRAVLPVFLRKPDGETFGMGTAFHLDGWGTLFTADHVVDHTRALHLKELQPNATIKVDLAQSTHATVLLGYGVVFGTVTIPERCWAPIQRIETIVQERDDPLARLRGESGYRVVTDIASLSALIHPEAPIMHSLPVDFRWQPKVGEQVFAVGYPELGLNRCRPKRSENFSKKVCTVLTGPSSTSFHRGEGEAGQHQALRWRLTGLRA